MKMTNAIETTQVNTVQAPIDRPLRDCVLAAMQNYFTQLDGEFPTDVYNMVLNEIEAPLLEVVMQFTNGNQSKAAVLLGLSRGTLRKKLSLYGLG